MTRREGCGVLTVQARELAKQAGVGKDSPDNVPNVVDRVSVVARVDARNVTGDRLKHGRPRWSHQSLRGRNQARQEDPPRQRRDLGIGEDGTPTQDGEETNDVELQLLQNGLALVGLQPEHDDGRMWL